jgi:hypothetical protein
MQHSEIGDDVQILSAKLEWYHQMLHEAPLGLNMTRVISLDS